MALLGRHLALALLAALAATVGCRDCFDDLVHPSYRVTVVNSETGERVCDAQVFVDAPVSPPQEIDCTFVVSTESFDPVTITASRDGFVSAEMVVHFETDECDKPIRQDVQIAITPA
jgi:hypothetical protein